MRSDAVVWTSAGVAAGSAETIHAAAAQPLHKATNLEHKDAETEDVRFWRVNAVEALYRTPVLGPNPTKAGRRGPDRRGRLCEPRRRRHIVIVTAQPRARGPYRILF